MSKQECEIRFPKKLKMAQATSLVYGFATEPKATHGIFLWRMRDLRCKGKIVIQQNISGQDRDCANIDLQIIPVGPLVSIISQFGRRVLISHRWLVGRR